jgi:hypothetical protein
LNILSQFAASLSSETDLGRDVLELPDRLVSSPPYLFTD